VPPKVSIVILNWNGRVFLEKFLPSVVRTVYANLEVIVADNASTDDSLGFLRKNYESVGIIELDRNYGYAGGYNRALKQVQADYYVLLNSDVEITPEWISPVIDLMEANSRIAACQPKILSYRENEFFEYAGAAGGWIDLLGYPFARGRVFDRCEKDSHQYDDEEPIFWASGAALFLRPKVFHEIGGFDEFFFAHMEEIDLCWRLQLAGYHIYVCPRARIFHVGGGTLSSGAARKTYLNYRNSLIMLTKNLPTSEALWKLPCRFLLDIISAFRFLISGNLEGFMAVIKAEVAFLRWLATQRKRSIFPHEKSINPAGVYLGCLVWSYFIMKKSTFAQIVQNKN